MAGIIAIPIAAPIPPYFNASIMISKSVYEMIELMFSPTSSLFCLSMSTVAGTSYLLTSFIKSTAVFEMLVCFIRSVFSDRC
jgi:hypothetical protein